MKMMAKTFFDTLNRKPAVRKSQAIAGVLFSALLVCAAVAFGQQGAPMQNGQTTVSAGAGSAAWADNHSVPAQPSLSQLKRAAGKSQGGAVMERKGNFSSFTGTHKNNATEVAQMNKGHENDPELGVLYPDAPCSNCYEVLDKRTETRKYFVQQGTNGTKFILQSGSRPLHYKDATGNWRTISDRLAANNTQHGVYATEGREVNVAINTDNGFTTITGAAGSLSYNRNLELVYVRPDGTEQSLGKANWADKTAGDDGVLVHNAWDGIDLEMGVVISGLKTNFIINKPMPAYAAGKLLLRDHMQMGKGMKSSLSWHA